mmetsp:Transcript_1177/g.2371  ORF Transcript_1177/g.2371 Transcript_1177/m.2371 type:complete len:217 (+) Transcript_1177:2220-2870(+)
MSRDVEIWRGFSHWPVPPIWGILSQQDSKVRDVQAIRQTRPTDSRLTGPAQVAADNVPYGAAGQMYPPRWTTCEHATCQTPSTCPARRSESRCPSAFGGSTVRQYGASGFQGPRDVAIGTLLQTLQVPVQTACIQPPRAVVPGHNPDCWHRSTCSTTAPSSCSMFRWVAALSDLVAIFTSCMILRDSSVQSVSHSTPGTLRSLHCASVFPAALRSC